MVTISASRALFVVSLLLAPIATSLAETSKECGELLSGPFAGGYTLYVFCPSLLDLSPAKTHELIVETLDRAPQRLAGDVRIFIFADRSVLKQERWPADQERLIASWGDALLGSYHTESGLLSVRSIGTDKWRNIYLPLE
ncbi:TPA: hypothetical protein ACNVA0_005621 [Citrobacter freundii]